MDETGATPAEWQRRTGAKVSARDVTVAQLIADRLRGPLRDLRFFGIAPARPVSFERLVLDDLDGHPFFGRREVEAAGLAGLFRTLDGQHVAELDDGQQSRVSRRELTAFKAALGL